MKGAIQSCESSIRDIYNQKINISNHLEYLNKIIQLLLEIDNPIYKRHHFYRAST